MSERFTRLFSLQPNLYAETSPVVIAAGALLKDNQSGRVLAQLKLRNIGAKEIKAARVSVCPLDTVGAPLGEALEHQYLDLTAKRGEEFGAKTPLPLADASTRAFSAVVTEAIFADNTIWKATGALWGTLPRPAKLEDTLGDEELLRQYHMKYGATCKYEPLTHKDLWYCTCGALNRRGETCHVCERALPDLQKIDLAALRDERDARLAAEQAAAEEKARAEAAAAEARAKKAKKVAKRTAMIVVPLFVLAVAAYFLTTLVIIPNSKYNAAVALMEAGQYTEAIAAFEAMDGYKDSAAQIEACETAILDGKYNDAVALMEAGQYTEAIAAFEAMDGYKDSAEQITECKRLGLKESEVGDYVFFGAYEQDNDASNGKEEIEWLILDIQDGKALLLSKYALDCKPYNAIRKGVTWETCTLRAWLNNDFINATFSADEKAIISTVAVSADKNPKYSTNPGSVTQDQIFLLSIDETNKYFSSDNAKQCKPTDYAVASGAHINGSNGNCWWWLRSPGYPQDYATSVNYCGDISVLGRSVNLSDIAVRPAIWIEIG